MDTDPQVDLARALNHYEWAVAEYRHQLEAWVGPETLKQFHVSVVEPALKEFERLTAQIEDAGRDLIEELRQCHEDSLAASRNLRNASKSMLSEDYVKLAEKVKAQEAKCHEVRLALINYRNRKPRARPAQI